jgi:integral membrane sensor domain MASE1
VKSEVLYRDAATEGLVSTWRRATEFFGIAVAYFALAKLGLSLASINPSASPIWPPTGFAIAAVILTGYRAGPAIFLAALLANASTAGSIYTSLAIALGNTCEALIGGYLIRRWSDGLRTFDSPSGVARFAMFCSAAATPISATVGVGSLSIAGYVHSADLGSVWMTWWLGDLASAPHSEARENKRDCGGVALASTQRRPHQRQNRQEPQGTPPADWNFD